MQARTRPVSFRQTATMSRSLSVAAPQMGVWHCTPQAGTVALWDHRLRQIACVTVPPPADLDLRRCIEASDRWHPIAAQAAW